MSAHFTLQISNNIMVYGLMVIITYMLYIIYIHIYSYLIYFYFYYLLVEK